MVIVVVVGGGRRRNACESGGVSSFCVFCPRRVEQNDDLSDDIDARDASWDGPSVSLSGCRRRHECRLLWCFRVGNGGEEAFSSFVWRARGARHVVEPSGERREEANEFDPIDEPSNGEVG